MSTEHTNAPPYPVTSRFLPQTISLSSVDNKLFPFHDGVHFILAFNVQVIYAILPVLSPTYDRAHTRMSGDVVDEDVLELARHVFGDVHAHDPVVDWQVILRHRQIQKANGSVREFFDERRWVEAVVGRNALLTFQVSLDLA